MKNKKNLITLDLTNVSSTDSGVNLFSFGTGTGATSTSVTDTYQVVLLSFVVGVQYQVTGSNNGIFSNYFTAPVINTIDALMLDFNSGGLNQFATFSYEVDGSAPNYKIYAKVTNPLFTFTDLSSLTPTVTTLFGAKYTTIKNSTVVATATAGFTYTELMNELQQQPCILNSVNVYASTLSQVSIPFYKTEREMTGVSMVNVDTPRIDPIQIQYALENIPLKFIPSPINTLQYTVKGSQSLRLFFYYTEILQGDDMLEQIENITPKKHIMIIEKQSMNPVFDLLGITTTKKVSIKDKLSSQIEPREITDEEVYDSFDGIDYTEY